MIHTIRRQIFWDRRIKYSEPLHRFRVQKIQKIRKNGRPNYREAESRLLPSRENDYSGEVCPAGSCWLFRLNYAKKSFPSVKTVAPTARSPRDLFGTTSIAQKFVDFEELWSKQVEKQPAFDRHSSPTQAAAFFLFCRLVVFSFPFFNSKLTPLCASSQASLVEKLRK